IEDIYLAALLKNEQDYNYVVGNPPYVRKEAIPTETKEALKERYPDTYSGNADLYVYFISRGIDWLSDNGKLGYVTSNKFTKTDYGEGVRKKITEETKILEYSNFERSNFFTDVTAYPCIFALENRDSADKYDIKVILAEGDPEEISSVTDKIREDLKKGKTVDRDYYSAYKTSSEDLGQREWRFIPKQANEVFQKLDRRKTDTLEGVTREISAGIKTGMNSVFVLNRDKAQKLGLEQDVLKPILRGSDIKRFNFEPAEEFVVYTEGIDIESHPETKDYLAQYKDKLANRSDGAFKGKEWYELNIPHSREIMDERKLVCPDISEENNFALDEQGRYILNTAYLILPEEEYEDKLKVLLGVLNSKPTEFYLKQISPPLRGGYHRYITKYLEPLPLILGDSKDEAIQEKVTEIRNIGITEDRVKNFPYGYDKEQEKEVKTLECNSGHPDMEPSIQTTQDGMFEVEVGKRKTDSVLVDSEEKARFVKKALEGDSASKGDEIEILVPRSNSDVKEILQEYEDDKEKLEDMPSVEE
ncbi:MAG: Eco57I restriction-modification methylase domain-containing protein, partial [Candidatus Nanohaloarchaea archaeon]